MAGEPQYGQWVDRRVQEPCTEELFILVYDTHEQCCAVVRWELDEDSITPYWVMATGERLEVVPFRYWMPLPDDPPEEDA
jgi:hypothetical protein